MAEYKKADEIVKTMTKKFDKKYADTTIKGIRDVFNMCVNCINQTPTADVEEVVRCKECKHCELRYPAKAIGEEAIEGYYCYPNQRYVKSTDFCNYGERGGEK